MYGFVKGQKMKKSALLLWLGTLALTGCSRHYVMKLSDGQEVVTGSKPRLSGAFYSYKDAAGHKDYVPQSRVLEIEPQSMAHHEKNPFLPPKK
jgi:uncharacterized protein YcfL